MPSPSRPPRLPPPGRIALHERTESHTNERAGSSVRMIGRPESHVNRASPNSIETSDPSPIRDAKLPAQEISPGTDSRLRTLALGSSLSPDHPPDTIVNDGDVLNNPRGIPVRQNTQNSSTEASFYTASRHESLVPDTSPVFGMNSGSARTDHYAASGGVCSDDVVELPTVSSQARSNSPILSSATGKLVENLPAAKNSDTSLSSTNSTGTMIVRKDRDGRKRASYSAFPYTGRPSSSKSNLSMSPAKKPLRRGSDETPASSSPVSPSSPVFAMSTERRITSVPEYVNATKANPNESNLQYPRIKPASAHGSRVGSTAPSSQRLMGNVERNQERWNPHLSTVPSEGTGSYSGGRLSQAMWSPDSSRVSQSSSNILSSRMSSDQPPLPRPSSDLPTIPAEELRSPLRHNPPQDIPKLPPPAHQRDASGSTIRIVNDRDIAGQGPESPLKAIPGSRDSEYITTNPWAQRGSTVFARPGSRASFFKDSIPAWAKAYYARPNSSNISKGDFEKRISTSTNRISLNIPRNRPQERRKSKLGLHSTRPEDLNLARLRSDPTRGITQDWSPHLWHDRTSLGRRRSHFKAPSVDEQAEGHALTKRNAQIALFAVGFIFPLAWWLGSVLPLPPKPLVQGGKGKNVSRHTQIIEDLEKQLGPIDEARYENARWWRNVNRVMAAIGLIIIAVIIALAVVSS